MGKAVSSVCPKCGTIGKFGKRSCCGRGGSWFRNCGSAGNTNVDHTWYEGIQVCKARTQAKTVISHKLNAGQQKNSRYSDMSMSSLTAVNASTTASARTSMVIPSRNMLTNTSSHTSASTRTKLLRITVHVILL